MAEMDQIFKAMSEGLKTLAQAITGIADKVEHMAGQEKEEKPRAKRAAKPKTKAKAAAKKAAPKKKTKAKSAAKKPKKAAQAPRQTQKKTALMQLNELIAQYPQGVDTEELKKKTGFDDKKIHNIVYKLKKQNKIKTLRKGIYASV